MFVYPSLKSQSTRAVTREAPRTSAGLTTAANVEIATSPALLGAPRSFVLNFSLLYARVDIRI